MNHRRRLARVAREIHFLEEPYCHVALRDELESMVLAEVAASCAAGDFAAGDPHEATRAVLVLCQGVADWYTPVGPKRPEEIARQYVDFALALVGNRTLPRSEGTSATPVTLVPGLSGARGLLRRAGRPFQPAAGAPQGTVC